MDEVYQIPANQWRYVDFTLKQQPALVSATFQVLTGSQQARIALMRSQDLERLRGGQPHGVLAVTPLASSGNLSYYVHWPDDYAIVVDNRADQPSAVHLRISLEFGGSPGPAVTRLSPPAAARRDSDQLRRLLRDRELLGAASVASGQAGKLKHAPPNWPAKACHQTG